MHKKLISIILPVYNEQHNIPLVYKEIIKHVKDTTYNFEIIFINDGSKDKSWETIKQRASSDSQVKGVNFIRNFGHQAALMAGYHYASGEAIISMDTDLQHPPEMIPSMIIAWQQGFDIVYIQNVKRNDNFLKKITAACYYKFLEKSAHIKTPRNVADFRLIDKKVRDIVITLPEKALYLRGLIAWVGFSYTIIPCIFAKRHAGQPGYTWHKMIKLALDGIFGFCTSPFKMLYFISLFIINSGLTCLIYHIVYPYPMMHYSSLTVIITVTYMLLGIQFFLIGLLYHHLSIFYQAIKKRPTYIITDLHSHFKN